jgi:hypothetical protein
LLAGFENGTPGSWVMEGREIKFIKPTGSAVDLFVRYERNGELVEEPIRAWIVGEQGQHNFDEGPWIFGGSQFKENPEYMGPGEHYVADITGSIVGLVTFGDETVGFSDVISDLSALRAEEWFADLNVMPPENSPATLIIRPFQRLPNE